MINILHNCSTKQLLNSKIHQSVAFMYAVILMLNIFCFVKWVIYCFEEINYISVSIRSLSSFQCDWYFYNEFIYLFKLGCFSWSFELLWREMPTTMSTGRRFQVLCKKLHCIHDWLPRWRNDCRSGQKQDGHTQTQLLWCVQTTV